MNGRKRCGTNSQQIPKVKTMKRSCLRATWTLAALAAAGGLLVPGCSSKFSSCRATRTCVEPSGGSAGESGLADGEFQAGSAGESAGVGGTGSGGLSGTSSGSSGSGAGDSGGSDAGAGGFHAAGAAGTAGEGGEETIDGPVDAVAPTVLSITPPNGATKLSPETDVIVITFGEPMNKASAESAFVVSSDSPTPTFKWNAAATELTIDPNLSYPAETDPNVPAVPFKFKLTTAAKDLAGNALASDVSWQFTLLRAITQSIAVTRQGTWFNGSTLTVAVAGAGDSTANAEARGFIGADILALPTGIVAFRGATIRTTIPFISGDPFGAFGNLLIQSVSVALPVKQAAFDAPAIRDLGVLIAATGHNAVGDPVSKDVLEAVKDDYANRVARGNRSQYRVLFPSAPNSNSTQDLVQVIGAGSSIPCTLTVEYLLP